MSNLLSDQTVTSFLDRLILGLQKRGVSFEELANAQVHQDDVEELVQMIVATIHSPQSKGITLNTRIENLPLPNRAKNILWHERILTVDELLLVTSEYLGDIRGIGEKTFDQIVAMLKNSGWSLYNQNTPRMSLDALVSVYGGIRQIPIHFVISGRDPVLERERTRKSKTNKFHTLGDVWDAGWDNFLKRNRKYHEHKLGIQDHNHLKKLLKVFTDELSSEQRSLASVAKR